MVFDQYNPEEGGKVSFSLFRGLTADEYHLMITPRSGGAASTQFRQIENAISGFIEYQKMANPVVFFQRFFASDICNQADIVHSELNRFHASAVAAIQQPSVNGYKLLAWVYIINFHSGIPEIKAYRNSFRISHNGYHHLFSSGLVSSRKADSFDQTIEIFRQYLETLIDEKMTLEANCVRTWIYVRDIDNNYQGMVRARNAIFDREGLSDASHFIASTGIEGQTAESHSLVGIDAYAIGGIETSQIRYLKGSSHLSPTHIYGVAFERGTAIDYGDRRHIIISGTASINHQGHILHDKDIEGQTRRVFENIKVLLAEAEATFSDVASMIVYLRDLADQAFINDYLKNNYMEIPYVVIIAPICRHGWLVEIECTAVRKVTNPAFRDF